MAPETWRLMAPADQRQPLVAPPTDDPYSLGGVEEVRPVRKPVKSTLSPLVSPELYVQATGRELCVLINREGASVTNMMQEVLLDGWEPRGNPYRFGHGPTVKDAMRAFVKCLHDHGDWGLLP